MKTIVAMLIMATSLVACSGSGQPKDGGTDTTQAGTDTAAVAPVAPTQGDSSAKTAE